MRYCESYLIQHLLHCICQSDERKALHISLCLFKLAPAVNAGVLRRASHSYGGVMQAVYRISHRLA
jgi:hypothetical protein